MKRFILFFTTMAMCLLSIFTLASCSAVNYSIGDTVELLKGKYAVTFEAATILTTSDEITKNEKNYLVLDFTFDNKTEKDVKLESVKKPVKVKFAVKSDKVVNLQDPITPREFEDIIIAAGKTKQFSLYFEIKHALGDITKVNIEFDVSYLLMNAGKFNFAFPELLNAPNRTIKKDITVTTPESSSDGIPTVDPTDLDIPTDPSEPTNPDPETPEDSNPVDEVNTEQAE